MLAAGGCLAWVIPGASAADAGPTAADQGALGPAGAVLRVDSLTRVEGAVRLSATLANRGTTPLDVEDALRGYFTRSGCVSIDLLDPMTGKRGAPVGAGAPDGGLAGACPGSKLPTILADGAAFTFVVDINDPGGTSLDVLPARTGAIARVAVTGAPGALGSGLTTVAPRSERLSTRVKKQAARVSKGSTTRIDLETDVLFAVDSAELSPKAGRSLAAAAELLESQPGRRLGVYGHTDATASDAYNLTLSRKRAAAVQAALAARLGAGWTYSVKGYGESRPLVPEQGASGAPDPAAQALNRRVEIQTLR